MSVEILEPQQEQEEDRGSRRMDPELKSMSAMLRCLEELDEAAKERVVAWIAARYQCK